MEPPLTDVEARVLGALIEKQITTPDNYPLSSSALLGACNQTSNRDPILHLDESTMLLAIVALRRRNLMRSIQPMGSRVTKYEHTLVNALGIDGRRLALLGVLLLRGPQTPGELHARTARLAEFSDIADLEATLDALGAHTPEPLATRLERRPGQKEVRYAQLLTGEPTVSSPSPAPATAPAPIADDRIASLERTVDELRAELADVRGQLTAFIARFE